MGPKRRGFGFIGRCAVALMVVAAMVALAVPAGLRVAAQDSSTVDVQTRGKFLHASPGLGKVEVHLNHEEKIDEFEYGDLSDWIDVPPGSVQVSITADRAGFNYLVFDAIYPAPAGNDYYAVITEQLVLAGAFDRSPIPDRGARVQVIQGSVSLPAVNVVATGTNVDWATQLTYPRSSEYSVVPAGTYNLDIQLADTGQSVLTVPNVTLNGDMVYELVIMGNLNDGDHPLEIRVLDDTTLTGQAGGTPSA
jgi:hypothetical protein